MAQPDARMEAARRTRGLRLVAMTVALAALLLPSAVARAAAPWLPATTLATSSHDVGQPEVAIAPDGTAYAVWSQSDGTNPLIRIASRPPGGAFGASMPLSAPGADATQPSVAVDRQGGLTITWLRAGVVESRYRPAGAGWGAVQTLSGSAGNAESPSLAVGDHGNAIAVWADNGSSPRVEAAIRPAGSPVFGSPVIVSPPDASRVQSPRAAMDAAGDAIVLWKAFADAGAGSLTWLVRTNERAAGDSFNPGASVMRYSAPTPGDAYAVRMTPDGRAIAVWDALAEGPDDHPSIRYIERRAGSTFAAGSWSSVGRASAASEDAHDPSVTIDDAGNTVAAWMGVAGSLSGPEAATGTVSGSFGTPIRLATTGFGPVASSSSNGTAVVLWNGISSDNLATLATVRRPGGAFGAAVPIYFSPPPTGATLIVPGLPRMALDDQGNGVAVLEEQVSTGGGNTYRILTVGFDPVAPVLTGVSVPSGAAVGQVVGMSARASDRGPATTIWAFGDGGSATGAAVQHAYGAPGTYAVTVTAVDRAGNRTSQTRTVQITSPAATGGGTSGGGGAPPVTVPKMVGAKVATTWKVKGTKLTLTKLTFKKLPKHWTAKVRCSGKKCPFKSKALKNKKVKHGTWKAIRALGKKHVFRARQTLEVRIGAPNRSTKVVRFALKKGKKPKAATLCLRPGAKRPAKSCS